MTTPMKLGYWNIRGLGQVSRLLAAYVGIQLDQTRYTQWNKWHGQEKQTLGLDFPNLPYLIDGQFKLTQSSAINQYIIQKGDKNQLLGKSTKDRARVDNILGVLKDALKQTKSLLWNKQYATLKAATLEKARVKLDLLQNYIGKNKFAIGYLTLADFLIAEQSYYFEAVFPEQYNNWSFFQTIRENLNNLPEIVAYYKSQKAMKQPFLPPQMTVIHPKFQPKLIVGYWGIRGLAQQIRLVLSYVGLPFQDKVYKSSQQWFQNDKINLGLAFPNIPYLIDGDFKLTESSAINRYVINKSQHKELLGKNIEETARIQSVMGVFDDVWAEVAKNFWKQDKQVIKQTLDKVSTKLDFVAKFVGQKSTIFGQLTAADFQVAEISHYIQHLFPEESKKWEFLGRIKNTINNLESTKAYYAREGAIKGPFLPQSAFVNPSFEQYQ